MRFWGGTPGGRRVAAVVAGCFLVACDGATELPRRGAALGDAFRTDRQIELERDEDDPVVDVTALAIRPDGGFLVVDQPADRVRAFGPDGSREQLFGGPGEGPGELRQPSSVAPGPDGGLYTVQRGGPRLTVYGPDGSTRSFNLPGHYGHWVASLGDRLAVGVGTRRERYAVVSRDGELVGRFGIRRPSPTEYPSGMFILDDNAAVAGDRVLVNTSFSPRVRVYDRRGDSLRSFGEPPDSWEPPVPPSVDAGEGLDASRAMREWLATFTMVTNLATVGDSLVVVQYGRYDPAPEEVDRVRHRTIDVYRLDGTKLYEDLPLEEPVLAGGDRLYTVGRKPPGPWTLNVYEWRGEVE